MNPDAEFIFCAGDDKVQSPSPSLSHTPLESVSLMLTIRSQTDEDMFRALRLPHPSASGKVIMEPPLSVTLAGTSEQASPSPDVELAIRQADVYTVAVGHSSKRTLATWHVTTPVEVIDHLLFLAGEKSRELTPVSTGSGTSGVDAKASAGQ